MNTRPRPHVEQVHKFAEGEIIHDWLRRNRTRAWLTCKEEKVEKMIVSSGEPRSRIIFVGLIHTPGEPAAPRWDQFDGMHSSEYLCKVFDGDLLDQLGLDRTPATTEELAYQPGENDYCKTIVTIEVLSQGPVSHNLEHLVEEINDGEYSGKVSYGRPETLTKRAAALALKAQGSDPCFLLGDEGDIYGLQPGDEVMWNPPGKEYDVYLTIREIEFPTDDRFCIMDVNRNVHQGFVSDLS